MDGLKKIFKMPARELPASTLVEVLAASIIFLVIFVLSLETVVRITSAEPIKSHRYLLVTDEMETLRKKYSSGEYRPGTYSEQHDWGTVTVTIEKYGRYHDIYVLTLDAAINNTLRNLESVTLFENES